MFLRHSSRDARRGVILIVVLALLTLFAIVGLSFVLYAQAEAESSRLYKEDKNLRQVLESPDRMWMHALSQLLYDSYDDATGVYSGLRGHSLGRSEYGFDYYIDPTTGAMVPNQTAFNGTGRLAYAPPAGLAAPTLPAGVAFTDAVLVNNTFYAADGFLRDPERLNSRAGLGANPNPVTGGINVPYTYPDLNNLFLAAINANGQILMPSFHRPWLFGAGNTPATNPNWEMNTAGKYLTLRPRPVDQVTNSQLLGAGLPAPLPPLETLNAGQQATLSALIATLQQNNQLFPYPEDATGDVKNLYWLPGGNDSYWIDLGYPVQVAPDGRKYKPMFAFFITDLDNRINLNVHGNIRGGVGSAQAHLSNQGWVKTEVNLSRVLIPGVPSANPLAPSTEWQQVFTGVPAPPQPWPGSFNQVTIRGLYGSDLVPNDPATYTAATGNQAGSGTFPHVYGQVDYDGGQLNFTPSLPIQLPNQFLAANGYSAFPAFGTLAGNVATGATQTSFGFDNGGGGPSPPGNAELLNHPLLHDFFKPFSDPINAGVAPDNRPPIDDRNFTVFDMKDLLNGGLVADASAAGPYGPAPTMAANAMKSQLGILLPYNFNDPLDIAGSLRRRSLVTTLSMDMSRPGMMPWMWDAGSIETATPNPVSDMIQAPRAGDDPVMGRAPYGIPSNFPNPATSRAGAIPSNSEFNIPGATPGTFPSDPTSWRAAVQAVRQLIGRLDLSQALPAYPVSPGYRFDVDAPNGPIYTQYVQAHVARVNLATDIYRTLRKLTGVQAIPVADQITPTETELMPRRWLAQLAVNIVDFIDADNISTPLNFYPDNEVQLAAWVAGGGQLGLPNASTSNALPTVNIGPGGTPPATAQELYRYWVFGTELPKIVLSEVFAEYTPPKTGIANTKTNVNVYAEFVNPLPALVPAANQGPWDASDASNVILFVPPNGAGTTPYAPYRVVIANTVPTSAVGGGPLTPRTSPPGPALPATTTVGNDNVLGTADQIRSMTVDDTLPIWVPPAPAAPPYVIAGAFSLGAAQVSNAAGNNGMLVAGTNNPPMSLPPQGYLVIGPGTNAPPALPAFTADANTTIPTYLGNGALAVPTAAMTYQVFDVKGDDTVWSLTASGPPISDNLQTGGITVLLRRLANPSMPPSMTPAGTIDPTFNPYFTADFMEGIVPNAGVKGANPPYHSIGKLQPYASANILAPGPGQVQTLAPQQTAATPYHTLGQQNNNNGNPPPAYDWLLHLDRQLVSPMELLNVSGYHPHELTHRFISTTIDPVEPTSPKFGHRIHWFDQTTRLYRLFEFVEVTDRAYGVTSLGRRPGKININTIWDPEILMALLDPQISNSFTAANVSNGDPTDTTTMYGRLMMGRSPAYAAAIKNGNPPFGTIGPSFTAGATDRPFLGMAAGNIPPGDPFFGNGMGINDTFLRVSDMTQNDPTTPLQGRPDMPRLFENPLALVSSGGNPATFTPNPAFPNLSHPYLRFEPLNKVYNNLTTRSNVFGVWCTIGYFEVIDDTARPVKLGAEIGKAAGTNVRHRFFSVLDRTQMVIARNLISATNGAGGVVVNPNNPLLGPGQAWVELDTATSPAPGSAPGAGGASIVGQVNATIPGRPAISWNIAPGTVLVVDRGTVNEEWVLVTQVTTMNPTKIPPSATGTPIWIQASFIRPHGLNGPPMSITQPGNPGPQPPIDVRDYFHAPVVPVSVNLNN
jgi:hypothetical protein